MHNMTLFARIVVSIWACLLGMEYSTAEKEARGEFARASSLPQHQPARVVTFTQRWSRRDLDFAPNGDSLFVTFLTYAKIFRDGELSEDRSHPLTVIYELDILGSEAARKLVTQRGEFRTDGVSPDGRTLYLVSSDGQELMFVDTDTGQVRQILAREGMNIEAEARLKDKLWRVSEADQTAWVSQVDIQSEKTRLYEWDFSTGKNKLLLETGIHRRGGDTRIWRRPLIRVPGDGARVLDLPRLSRNAQTEDEILVRDLGHGGEVLVRIPIPSTVAYRPLFSSDGKRVFLTSSRFHGGVRGWDLNTGQRLPAFSDLPEKFSPFPFPAAYDGQSERLFVTFYGKADAGEKHGKRTGVVLVGDTRRCGWVAQLAYPETAVAIEPHTLKVSPDGRWLATVCQVWRSEPRKEIPGRHTAEVVLWDLSVLE